MAFLLRLGVSGSGKTALLCNWIDSHSKKNPEDIIVYHFIGCATNTTGSVSALIYVHTSYLK